MADITQAERDAFSPLFETNMANFMNIPEEVRAKMMADFMSGDEQLKAE